jgi:hypothetical protein
LQIPFSSTIAAESRISEDAGRNLDQSLIELEWQTLHLRQLLQT